MNDNTGQGPPAKGTGPPGHHTARFFHVLFKIVTVVYFFASGFSGSPFTVDFTILLVLLVMDFWTVKNVTGRLLVGMRWWNDVTEHGEGWRFESLIEGQRELNKGDKFWFWLPLVITPALWLLFGVMELIGFKLHWVLLCVMAMGLSVTNLWGYFKCSREAKKMLAEYAQSATQHAIQSSIQAAINNV